MHRIFCWGEKGELFSSLCLDKLFQLSVARSLTTVNFSANQIIYKISIGEPQKIYMPLRIDGFLLRLVILIIAVLWISVQQIFLKKTCHVPSYCLGAEPETGILVQVFSGEESEV